ncbi:hypothetical protein PanWU01x14_232010, partial [Parasponia andersonii]
LVSAASYGLSLSGVRFGQIAVLSGQLAPCAHLPKIALNALSGSRFGVAFYYILVEDPWGFRPPNCRGKGRTGLSLSRIGDGLGPNLRQPNGRCGITCDSRGL